MVAVEMEEQYPLAEESLAEHSLIEVEQCPFEERLSGVPLFEESRAGESLTEKSLAEQCLFEERRFEACLFEESLQPSLAQEPLGRASLALE